MRIVRVRPRRKMRRRSAGDWVTLRPAAAARTLGEIKKEGNQQSVARRYTCRLYDLSQKVRRRLPTCREATVV